MRNNYINILEERVEIPIIQRDYAQGRTDSKTSKIRKDFLDFIFEFILHKQSNTEAELDLDFIYGLNKPASFIPIDGQQRITTLWLLYWFIAAKEKVKPEKKIFLKNFMYETRYSTTQFCKNLVSFDPDFDRGHIHLEIKNQSWYIETWNYDPGIQAMLVMLDDIEKRYAENTFKSLWDLIGPSTCPFHFYKLDMDKVGLSDDLYIKMNSRGKPLTEFEYFKAGFTELLVDPGQRQKFEISIDGIWMDTIWHMLFKNCEEEDIAFAVDQAFLNLFNFISSIISFKQDIKTGEGDYYENTESTPELLKLIYKSVANQDYLFETLDAICENAKSDFDFWETVFYNGKSNYEQSKTRLFFPHGETNLLHRCLLHFDDFRGLSFPERVLLSACFCHFRNNDLDFEQHIRTIRNLVVNSEFELRETTLGKVYQELEQYIATNDANLLLSLKTDQIQEEKEKLAYLQQSPTSLKILRQLEDSDIFRGSITLIPLDDHFNNRALCFLNIFDEDDLVSAYEERCNLLLCFGDYSQKDGGLKNLLSRSKRDIRKFLTTPGYNKKELYSATQKVVTSCLDYFIANPTVIVNQKIQQTLNDYDNNPRDWRYYFLKYPSFRINCQYGYYDFVNGYPLFKMSKKQFNGYHWNPFLHELFLSDTSRKISLENYGYYDKLLVKRDKTKLWISGLKNGRGYHIENANATGAENGVLKKLVDNSRINAEHIFMIDQDWQDFDLQDRIEQLKILIAYITS